MAIKLDTYRKIINNVKSNDMCYDKYIQISAEEIKESVKDFRMIGTKDAGTYL